ncbi:MAG: endopeptidase La [Candidatus Hydrogenedentes bacterium]|nr:endopeptidase La [Candidatus Hydrogenedentota bacterium]
MAAKNTVTPARKSERLPLLPLKDVVVFPRMVLPLLVGRAHSVGAVEESLASGRAIFLCSQRDPDVEEPGKADVYEVGVKAEILQTLRGPENTMKVVVEGIERCEMRRFFGGMDHDEVQVAPIEEEGAATGLEGLMRTALTHFETYVKLGQRIAPEIPLSFSKIEEPAALADALSAYLSLRPAERQGLLELRGADARLEKICKTLLREIDLLRIEQKTSEQFREQMEHGQRERYLQEQLRIIHEELGNREGGDEIQELRAHIEEAKLPKEALERALREIGRYERMPPLSPESAITQTYIEWLSEVPWSKRTRDSLDLSRAQKILDEDHYGLEKVKERILEFLAVRKLSRSTKGPVLCLVGPPGVGKTSLGRSVARAMGRKFVRVSLGGIRDEAEIRGHRRTYIGALPGRIVQSMKKCGVKNPVFMLDEIDKLSVDFRGDPSSALLEALDPEQNKAFSDHYLEVDFDLHEVFFITTANSEYDIPEALLDRMEIVRLPGYTTFEKERIAELFLLPKQIKESGLSDREIHFTTKGLETIIFRYTREAGVRELERKIANVCRKVARQVVDAKKGKVARVSVTEKRVISMLGPPPYSDIDVEAKPETGVCVGLAWTQDGGDTLIVETLITRGKGELRLTGQLGEVMQESAQAAYTYLRAHAKELQIPTEFWKNRDVHVHLPEGAIPKDGPSGGCAIVVSLLSAMRKRPPMAKMAITGEITLRGRILAVGGLKEKVLAAHRARIETIFLPKLNEKELVEVPKEVQRDIRFVFVESLNEIIRLVFPARRKKPS